MQDLNAIVSDPNIKTLFDPAAAARKFKIDPRKTISEPPSVLSIVDESGKASPTFTKGSFSLLIGKAKSKKTFLSVLLMSSFLGYKNEKIRGNPGDRPSVLWFDTEQSHYHLSSMVKRCCRLLGDAYPVTLSAYMLRTCTTDERIQLIEYTIKNSPQASLVVIDGIRDLVYDINSPEQATTIATRLMQWSADYDIHIINVLHQNKGDGNARGHLGTELTNKAESVISIEVSDDPAISTVTAEYCRDIEFKPFSFKINDDSLPELCNTPSSESGQKRVEPNFVLDEKHNQILKKIFKDRIDRKYSDLLTNIKLEFAEAGTVFGDNKSRDYLTYYINKGWIKKDEKSKMYRYDKPIF